MPAAAIEPEKLKKAQLQRGLRDHGLTVSGSLLKSELVELYKERILQKFSGVEPFARITRSTKKMTSSEDQSEAGSVEIVKTIMADGADIIGEGRKSPRRVKKKPVRYIEESEKELRQDKAEADEARVELERIDHTMADVAKLSDQDLANELKLRGFDVGPIGPTTRKIYEKRLEKLQIARAGDSTRSGKPESSDRESEEEEDVEVLETPGETRNRQHLLLGSQEKSETVTRRRPMRSRPGEEASLKEPMEISTVPSMDEAEAPAKPERRWKPVFIVLLIVAILVILLYFVFLTMESNPPKRIPHP